MQPHLLVPQQVPEFVRAEYPAFLEFLKAYYQWLEEQASLGKLEDLLDVDNTVDGFLRYFRKQLDVYGITARSDDKLYLRHIKELYAAKGSNASYEFLFKILFNKTSNTSMPWDKVFVPSNGKWVQDTTLLVRVPVGFDPNTLEGNPIAVTTSNGFSYRTYVRNISRRTDGVIELFITRIVFQGKLVSLTTTSGLVIPVLTTTVRAIIENPGSGFRVGQVFRVDSYGGEGTLCKVKSVNSTGGITALDLIRFGVGYTTDFNVLMSPFTTLDASLFNARITLGSLTYPTNDIVNPQTEEGSIVKHNYTNYSTAYMEDPTYVGETVAEIKHQNASVIYDGVDYASIKFITGQMSVYPGYYADSNNVIGDAVHIQDSYYYQVYSYVTEVDEALSSYSDILRSVLHPAGSKHFALYQITNSFQLDVQVDPSLNILTKEDAIRNLIETVDQLILSFTKNASDIVDVSDTVTTAAEFYRSMVGLNVGVSDSNFAMEFTLRVTDGITVTDSDIDVAIAFVSNVASAETLSFDVDKYINLEVQTANGLSGLYMAPYYVEQDPAYWQAGYLENEREFTN